MPASTAPVRVRGKGLGVNPNSRGWHSRVRVRVRVKVSLRVIGLTLTSTVPTRPCLPHLGVRPEVAYEYSVSALTFSAVVLNFYAS